MTVFQQNLTLLIIDDDVVNISTLTSLFAQLFNIEVAHDGKAGLQSILLKDIDLVLSKVHAPMISGQELCTFVKDNRLTSHIPIVLLTPNATADEEEACLSIGAIDYIDLNARPKTILFRIKNHMNMVAQQKRLAQVSCTDGLTGLANRMQLDTMLNKEWYAAVRGNHSIAILLIDIDNFKLFNDEFGHLEGDKCLKTVASIIAKSKRRERDFAARYGGEEFVLLLPFTDLEGAIQVADSLISKIRNRNIKAAKDAHFPMVTISVGITAYVPKHNKGIIKNPIDLLNCADKHLFKAKQNGRNCYSASEEY
ncbi:diguanylate cyclase [Paraglaciecola marina]|uniref:GGDEF domain-containing response regulator n=1 Tax=Paraglaciecola marina TaxID=2500157 RepID=UPI00105B2F78|nr:diguanylate cyclase [Paraglaciecola marina]